MPHMKSAGSVKMMPLASELEAEPVVCEMLVSRMVPRRPTPAWVLKASARLLTALAELRGREPDLTPESAEMTSHDIVCDSGLAERELGYRSVPLRDMIRDTIDWMKEKGLLS